VMSTVEQLASAPYRPMPMPSTDVDVTRREGGTLILRSRIKLKVKRIDLLIPPALGPGSAGPHVSCAANRRQCVAADKLWRILASGAVGGTGAA